MLFVSLFRPTSEAAFSTETQRCIEQDGKMDEEQSSQKPGQFQFFTFLFCRSWMALVSFRKVRGLMVFHPFLKFMIAHLAAPDRRASSLLENCFASARI
jgi:hypothetical protein